MRRVQARSIGNIFASRTRRSVIRYCHNVIVALGLMVNPHKLLTPACSLFAISS